MAVLTIRAHQRFAVRSPSKMKRTGARTLECLLIELSQDGARVSNLGDAQFEIDDEVTLTTGDGHSFPAIIRWSRKGCAGLRLTRPLYQAELLEIITAARGEEPAQAKVA
ncbi:PilZ domain-containing protein [Aurantiacibacter sediminis]|uniref:PilZ domain-containing protein n=1 Tax=Aurantiacibacter sediminis TaxID=2793064 RepID=A0ABS0N4L6_9SPHN|nr:PilZ domain-containing protein [Aurantiacibacter sediminis]MBH5322391.1 PilZ domain-containing protein [Aurantiacibacter sediminis]